MSPYTLSAGASFGPYEILAVLGAGGMGEVYRATDTTLKRQVALKLLSSALVADRDRLTRFQREAEVLASLNHPNIAAIYGVEEAHGARALVMELVEGPTLADRIARGPIPADEALPIARQIAEALDAAHERGIIHRDLKPANIALTNDGVVKILDFGLAKTATFDGPSDASPTLTAMTEPGAILGTAAYMAPEQARGRGVDKRADIWAFGAVLFEMLTGRRAFDGETVSESLASVLTQEPRWSALPPSTPEPIARVLHRCLDKDPKRRLRDIGEARVAIEEALSGDTRAAAGVPGAAVTDQSQRRRWLALVVIAALTAGAAASAAWLLWRSTDPPRVMTLEIAGPEGGFFARVDQAFVLAPDGAHAVAIVRDRDNSRQRTLWLRTMESGVSAMLPGTENARTPFWSPDSRWVGFFADGKLKKIAIGGGRPQVLCDALQGYGSWSTAGVILFAAVGQPLQRVADTGGTPAAAIPFDDARHETVQMAPFFLPDGRHFLYDTRTSGTERGIAWASLDGRERRFLIQNRNSPATYAANPEGGAGWMLYNSGLRLLAHRINPERGELIGEPKLVADSVSPGPQWSASTTGLIAFPHFVVPRTQLTWRGRDGSRLGAIGEPGVVFGPAISPDGKTIAYTRVNGRTDVWLFDVTRSASTRLTFEEGGTSNAVWTPDGNGILYMTQRQRRPLLIERPAGAIGDERVRKVFPDTDQRSPTAVSRDGRWVTVAGGGGGDGSTLLLGRADGKEVSFAEPRSVGAISPDGRWVAFRNDSSGRSQVFVQSVPRDAGGPVTPAKFQVSSEGGDQPVWRADGRELFYLAPNRDLVAVPIEAGEAFFRIGKAAPLFNSGAIRDYAVTADGQRFVISEALAEGDSPMTLIVNWTRLVQ